MAAYHTTSNAMATNQLSERVEIRRINVEAHVGQLQAFGQRQPGTHAALRIGAAAQAEIGAPVSTRAVLRSASTRDSFAAAAVSRGRNAPGGALRLSHGRRRVHHADNASARIGCLALDPKRHVVHVDARLVVTLRIAEAASRIDTAGLFVMVGAAPNTAWLQGLVQLDGKGFVMTSDGYATSCPGIFAVGDVRAGSVKRVASSVGDPGVLSSTEMR